MLLQNASLISPLQSAGLTVNIKSFQVGEILQALVQAREGADLLSVRVGNKIISARTTQHYQVGETLKLQVIANKDRLILENIDGIKSNGKSLTVNKLLRHDLPKQASLEFLSRKLMQISSGPESLRLNRTTLAPAIMKEVNATRGVLPSAAGLIEPKMLKNLIRDSGLFLEAKLAATIQNFPEFTSSTSSLDVKSHLKANLIRLADAIEQSLKTVNAGRRTEQQVAEPDLAMISSKKSIPPELSHKVELLDLKNIVEASISKIQINQSQALVTEDHRAPIWVVDLPVADLQDGKPIELKIQYEQSQDPKEDSVQKWTVNLSLDIAPLGKIFVTLHLSGEQLSSSIWAENQLTNLLIQGNLEKLKTKLEKTGLQVLDINQHPIKAQNATSHYHSPLLHTKI